MARRPILVLLALAFTTASALDIQDPSTLADSAWPNAGRSPSILRFGHGVQRVCSVGYEACSSGQVCCPAGGDCCSDNVCCPQGQVCTMGRDGRVGCCPIGQRCADPSGCAVAGHFECLGDTFCCPLGQICSRVDGIPACESPALVQLVARQGTSTGGGATTTTTATPTTTITTPTTTPTTTTPTTTPTTTAVVSDSSLSTITSSFSSTISTNTSIPGESNSPAIVTATNTTSLRPSSGSLTSTATGNSTRSGSLTATGNSTRSGSSTRVSSTTSFRPTGNPSGLVTATTTTSTFIPIPTNATVPLTSPEITYTGNWTAPPTPPVCSGTTESRRSSGTGNKLTYSFTGTAIYLNLAANPEGGLYSVDLDGETTELDSYAADTTSCKVGFSKEGLENKLHSVVITTLGPSPQAPSTSEGVLDIENILVTHEDSPPPPRSSGAFWIGPNRVLLALVYGATLWLAVLGQPFS